MRTCRVHVDERVLDISSPLVALEEGGAGVAAGTRLCVLDTPGPNEAGEEGLRFQVRMFFWGGCMSMLGTSAPVLHCFGIAPSPRLLLSHSSVAV